MHSEADTAKRATSTPIWLRVLNWLADRDAAHRAARKLRAMPDYRLDDLGIAREQADLDFYQRGSRRADAHASTKLTRFKLG